MSSLELQENFDTRPKKVLLSRYLIALLHFGGVPAEFFLGLLSIALAETECSRYDIHAALKFAVNNEGIDNDRMIARMIWSGMPLDEPYLLYRLGILMGEEIKGLQARKIPISDSYYLMGTADPTGKLCANQVCIILDKGQVSGDVLVYKHLGLHPRDIHLLKATFVEGLEKIVGDSKFVIFFPIVGPRSLADEMGNSDFDGDTYWVSRHPELLKNFNPSPPWLPPEENLLKKGVQNMDITDMNSNELEGKLFHSFLNNRFQPRCDTTSSSLVTSQTNKNKITFNKNYKNYIKLYNCASVTLILQLEINHKNKPKERKASIKVCQMIVHQYLAQPMSVYSKCLLLIS
ncbi:putative RNA-dependent RNA polymerase 4 isoform X3 [Carex rostrata]